MADCCTHTHEHSHDHEHGHHHHDHEHHHHHDHPADGAKDKTAIWLSYTLDHNIHHTEEMADFAKQLETQGKTALSQAVAAAAAAYGQANELLKKALEINDL